MGSREAEKTYDLSGNLAVPSLFWIGLFIKVKIFCPLIILESSSLSTTLNFPLTLDFEMSYDFAPYNSKETLIGLKVLSGPI